eukprot:CAMPEP_0174251312 /NCGR_PEP_ID=MMETSP0439-20130205/1171_1 /TAXON_ID=0 /ORGANISM="Stereomyxa ramosa, Strain Chinc5" /LENGTH=397 /DNA_ID=CAMNT_0015331587 /DNA_START=31 /DNA_END=1221 /DNA_ORIENTATION=-
MKMIRKISTSQKKCSDDKASQALRKLKQAKKNFSNFHLKWDVKEGPKTVWLLTSNIGNLFEHPSIIGHWCTVVALALRQKDADFVGFSFQEIGGKDSAYLDPLPTFCKAFETRILQGTDYVHSGLIWEDDQSDKDFTALATMFLLKKEFCASCKIKDFHTGEFIAFEECNPNETVLRGDRSQANFLQYKKFRDAQGRKGYSHLQIKFGDTYPPISFINVHLFPDYDNLKAAEKCPSVYAEERAKGLTEICEVCEISDTVPAFLFGDFNMRLDAKPFLEWAREEYKDQIEEDPEFLVLEKSKFILKSSHELCNQFPEKLKVFDNEIQRFNDNELPIKFFEKDCNFCPTYAIDEEDPDSTDEEKIYIDKRIPAWCDKVIFTSPALDLINHHSYHALFDD